MERIGRLSIGVALVTSSVLGSAAPMAAQAGSGPPMRASMSQVSESSAFPPPAIAFCNAGFGEYTVTTYTSRALGTIRLRCGDSRDGYVHIRQRHERAWQRVVDIAGGGGNWDDLMDFMTRQAIEAPSPGYPEDVGRGKLCFTTPALIISNEGVVVRTLMPTVIVSRDNKKVITSIPTTGSPDCR